MLEGPLAELLQQPGFVHPRYLSPDTGDAIPLDLLIDERVLTPGEPAQIALVGPRGSGLTTALTHVARRIREPRSGPRRVPVPLERLLREPREAVDLLASGEGVLLIDTSTTPVSPARRRAVHEVFTRGFLEVVGSRDVLRSCRLVIAVPEHAFRGKERWREGLSNAVRVDLAPWSQDELLELLGSSERYREARARVFGGLQGLPPAGPLLRRPLSCRLLVEAALGLAPDEPFTLARLYANLLDSLEPALIELLLELDRDALDVRDLVRLLGRGRLPAALPLLIELPRSVAELLSGPPDELVERAGRRLQLGEPLQLAEALDLVAPHVNVGDLRTQQGAVVKAIPFPLALPGLHGFLQAGRCAQAVSRGELPEGAVRRRWFPFVPELFGEAAREHLREWLRRPPRRGSRPFNDAAPASLLWAVGETPRFGARAGSLRLRGAILEGVDLSGLDARDSTLDEADLRRATLTGASLWRATLRGARLEGADLRGASLAEAILEGTQCPGADLTEATLAHAELRGVRLSRARLARARAASSTWSDCDLSSADLSEALLDEAKLERLDLTDADLRGASLRRAQLFDLDLARAQLAAAWLAGATLTRCRLQGLALEELNAPGMLLHDCDLSELALRRGVLSRCLFELCQAHGAVFDGADLRRAIFDRVDFQAGSSRAGLLLGKPALEGSMTGFYAEGTTDDAWTPPEATRQASFVGADLRGARFEHTDLFRVDFRGARLDLNLREQAKKAGALLEG